MSGASSKPGALCQPLGRSLNWRQHAIVDLQSIAGERNSTAANRAGGLSTRWTHRATGYAGYLVRPTFCRPAADEWPTRV